jgi:hypothetical protein
MRKLLLLLLTLFFLASSAGMAQAKDNLPRAPKKAFKHDNTAGTRKNNRAQFRKDNHPPTLNLHPKDPTRFTKVKADKPYKYSKGN